MLQMQQRGLRDCLSNNAAFFMGNHTPGLSTAAATLHQTRQAGAFKKLLDVDRTDDPLRVFRTATARARTAPSTCTSSTGSKRTCRAANMRRATTS